VEMLAPYKGRVYDPCCGSAGMFVQSEKFVEEHGGRIGNIAVYGQESNSTTRRLVMMNLDIRGIEGDLAVVATLAKAWVRLECEIPTTTGLVLAVLLEKYEICC